MSDFQIPFKRLATSIAKITDLEEEDIVKYQLITKLYQCCQLATTFKGRCFSQSFLLQVSVPQKVLKTHL